MTKKRKISPYLTIIISFFTVIMVGSLLLMLPISITDSYKAEIGSTHLSFVNALFMSTTSVCVTGLTVIPNVGTSLTIFGKIIMVILVEIGGLSFLTLAIFVFTLLGVKLSISDRFLMKEVLNQNSVGGIVRLVRYIIIVTFSYQFISAICTFFILTFATPGWDAGILTTIGTSIFHSVSSFNNAGLDIFGDSNNMINYSNNILLNLNTMISIIVGGIGFIVIFDLLNFRKTHRLSIHTRIVLPTTLVLIFGGALLFKLVQPDMSVLQALFQSVSARTAGFATYPMEQLNTSSTLIMDILMLIGASPCSTGGGLKTTTFFIIIIFAIAFARGKTPTYCHRKISNQSIMKAFSLLSFVLMYLVIVIFVLTIIEDYSIDELSFETISAFATVGLSKGITPALKPLSKLIIVLTMFLGRIGPLTVMSMLNKKFVSEESEEVKYIEEKIIIG